MRRALVDAGIVVQNGDDYRLVSVLSDTDTLHTDTIDAAISEKPKPRLVMPDTGDDEPEIMVYWQQDGGSIPNAEIRRRKGYRDGQAT